MGRSQETFRKKGVREKKEKKRREKEKKRLARKEEKEKGGSADDMIAYVDEKGMISSEPPDPEEKEEIKAESIEISVPKKDPRDKPDPVRSGKLYYFNDSKGFGFIQDSETREEVFVHINNMIDEISENDLVRFEVEMGPRGPNAVNVKLLE